MANIAALRLYSQLLAQHKFTRPEEIVSHFGAMQAQDYAMSKWAIGVRLPGASHETVEKAIDSAAIVRIHLMRPTWHLVASEDLHWMLELTSANVLRQMNGSNRLLGLDESIFRKSNDLIAESLENGHHLTKDELMRTLQQAGIKTHEHRGLHIMLYAEMSGLVCNGERNGKNHTYALLEKRVRKSKDFTKEEALAELAKRYFTSHGPATLKDFIWWSGLGVADAKKALAFNDKNLVSLEADGETYWLSPEVRDRATEYKSLYLLPAFDEFLISYKDRSASIEKDFAKLAFTGNGIFKPVIVANGQVDGIWKRTLKKDKLLIETDFFIKSGEKPKDEIIREAQRFGEFMGEKTEILFQ